jgi:hypothetical protein
VQIAKPHARPGRRPQARVGGRSSPAPAQ